MEGSARVDFDDYVLDLSRGCLLRAGNEVPLRPKTFGVLKHLVEHSGQLVSKEELLAAVWPNLIVTDDTLVQSIGELRRVFAESGRDYITTVPRRGYRFEAPRAAPVRCAAQARAAMALEVRHRGAPGPRHHHRRAVVWLADARRGGTGRAGRRRGGATHDRRTAFSKPERRLRARISGRWTHAGHHQFVGAVFRRSR